VVKILSEIETNLENKLGEPDSVTYYYEDGLLFVERSGNKRLSNKKQQKKTI
jgi:signal transduction histidine kinase